MTGQTAICHTDTCLHALKVKTHTLHFCWKYFEGGKVMFVPLLFTATVYCEASVSVLACDLVFCFPLYQNSPMWGSDIKDPPQICDRSLKIIGSLDNNSIIITAVQLQALYSISMPFSHQSVFKALVLAFGQAFIISIVHTDTSSRAPFTFLYV